MDNFINMQQVMFYFEDAINDSRYNNTFFYVGMKKKDSNKIKNIPFTIDNVLSNNYLTNFMFDTEYDYYISTNTFKNRNSKSSENLFSIQMLTIDVDCHNKDIKTYTLDRDIDLLIDKSKKLKYPICSNIRSGRGVQLQFRIEKTSYKMKEYVERIINKLMEEVQDIINRYSLGLEVDTASKNLAGYFRAGNSYNTHTQGKQAAFIKYNDNRYSFQEMSEYYHIFKHDKDLVNKTKNKVKEVITGKNNQLNNLHNKRLDTVCNVLNDRQSVGNLEGGRDKALFLACVSYYYLNKHTCLDNLVRLNNALSSPLNRSEIDGIYSYVSDKNGLLFKNQTFFDWLNLNQAQMDTYNAYKISREQSKERTERRLDRNTLIIAEYNGKNCDELSKRYNLSVRQIRNITKDKHNQIEEEKYQAIIRYISEGVSKKAIAIIMGTSKKTIYNIINRHSNVKDTPKQEECKKGNACAEYVVQPQALVSSADFGANVLSLDNCEVSVSHDYNSLSHMDVTSCSHYNSHVVEFLDYQLFRLSYLDDHSYAYLNKYDLSILKTLYAYTLYKHDGASLIVDLTVDKLYYLCLPEWTLYKPYFDDELCKYKEWIISAYDTDVFPDTYYGSRYSFWGDRFAYSALKKIRQSLRKLVYLGFITSNELNNNFKYERFSVCLNSLNFDLAQDRYIEFKRNGLSFTHLVCDNYVSMHLDDNNLCSDVKNIHFKSNDNLMNLDASHELNMLFEDNTYLLWKDLSNRVKVFATRFENKLSEYSIIKVKNKDMLQKYISLGIQGIHIGSKVIVSNGLLN